MSNQQTAAILALPVAVCVSGLGTGGHNGNGELGVWDLSLARTHHAFTLGVSGDAVRRASPVLSS